MFHPRIDVRRILCPTDFSEIAEGALDHAMRIASFFEATVQLLHVIRTAHETLSLLATRLRDGSDRPRDVARAHLDALVAQCIDWHVAIEPVVRVGDPTRVILREAEERRADLIVMGGERRAGLDLLFMGSVAEQVMQRAACPVLAIGAHAAPIAAAPPYRRILCPTKLVPDSDATVAYATALAEESEAEVEVLHVIESLPPGIAGDEALAGTPLFEELRRRRLNEADDELMHVAPPAEGRWCTVRRRIATGDAAAAILEAARANRADVIVMGVQAGPFDRALFGSTIRRVARDAPCSVLVVGGAWRRAAERTREPEPKDGDPLSAPGRHAGARSEKR